MLLRSKYNKYKIFTTRSFIYLEGTEYGNLLSSRNIVY